MRFEQAFNLNPHKIEALKSSSTPNGGNMKRTSLVLLAGFSAITIASVGCDPNSGKQQRGKVNLSNRSGANKMGAHTKTGAGLDTLMTQASPLGTAQSTALNEDQLNQLVDQHLKDGKEISLRELAQGKYEAKQIVHFLRFQPLKESLQNKATAFFISNMISKSTEGAIEIKPSELKASSSINSPIKDDWMRMFPIQFNWDQKAFAPTLPMRMRFTLEKGQLKTSVASGDLSKDIDILQDLTAVQPAAGANASTPAANSITTKIFQRDSQIIIMKEEISNGNSGNKYSAVFFTYEKVNDTPVDKKEAGPQPQAQPAVQGTGALADSANK